MVRWRENCVSDEGAIGNDLASMAQGVCHLWAVPPIPSCPQALVRALAEILQADAAYCFEVVPGHTRSPFTRDLLRHHWNRDHTGNLLSLALRSGATRFESDRVLRCSTQQNIPVPQWHYMAASSRADPGTRIILALARQRFSFSNRESLLLELCAGSAALVQLSQQLPDDGSLKLRGRCKDVFDDLRTGRSEKEIAHHLGLSRNTVHVYAKSIYQRYRVHSRAELLSHFLPADMNTVRREVDDGLTRLGE